MKKTFFTDLSSLLLPLGLYGVPTQAAVGYQRSSYLSAELSTASTHGPIDVLTHAHELITREAVASDELDIASAIPVNELVVIDAAVPDKHALYRNIKPGLEIVELDANTAGLAQLTNILQRYKNLSALHIISHAEDGILLLGSSRVDAQVLQQEVDIFNALSGALADGADLLFYGCNLAKGEAGEEFLNILQANTQLNIAASNDLTGNSENNGDWDLEIQRGEIDTDLAFSARALADFTAILQTTYRPVELGYGYAMPSITTPDNRIVISGLDGAVSNFDTTGNDGAMTAVDTSGGYGNYDYIGARLQFASNPAFTSTFELHELKLCVDSGVPGTPSVDLVITGYNSNNNSVGTANVTVTTARCFNDDFNASQTLDLTATFGSNYDLSRFVVSYDGVPPSDRYFVFKSVTLDDIKGLNTAPTATNLTQSKSATEGGSAVVLDDIVATDPDVGDTVTATLTFSNAAAGALSTGTYGSATSTFNTGTGVWTVTGLVADVNAALAAVAFTPSADNDQNFTITTRIRDAADTGPADGTISFNVTAVNDAPTATNLTQSASATEDGSAVALDDVVITDPDTGETVTAVLTLSDAAAGALSSGTYGSATSSFNAGTGIWTVTGSVSDVNAALAAVTFTPSADNDQNFTIATRVRDVAGTGPADGTITVTVTGVNDAPTDITLNNASVSQSATASGTDVGTLTTNDVESLDNHTYSLVSTGAAGSGSCASDSDNASFQINGSTLETASELTPGSYSLCVQTSDGTATYKEGFVVTVSDDVSPVVSSVSVPPNKTYTTGETLSFIVNTTENVTVTGIPNLPLTIGATVREAAYVSGSGTSALVFGYAIQAGDSDIDGIAIGASAVLGGGTMRDVAGNDLTLLLDSVDATSGVLVDAVAPTLQSLSPADDSTTVATGANLVMTFSEDITFGAGDITIYDSLNTQVAVIDVASHGGQLSITGDELTINPTADLSESTSYYILVDNGAVTDFAGIDYAGIADSTSWNFIVADVTPPTVTSITVAGSPSASAEAIQFTVTFDEVPANISINDFTLTPSGPGVSGSIASNSPVNANTVTVTIDQITGTGALRLDVNANSGITDTLGNGNGANGFVPAYTSGELHTVDREAPGIPANLQLSTASDSGTLGDNITNDNTPTITGTADANATVEVTSGVDGVLGTTTANGSGDWSYTPGSSLTEGSHNLTATAADAAGNESAASTALTLLIDTVAPTATVALADSNLLAGETSLVTISFSEAITGFANDDLTLANGTLSAVSSADNITWTGTFTPAGSVIAAANVITLDNTGVTDVAGNSGVGTTDSANYAIDTLRPIATIVVADTELNAGETSLVTITFNRAISGFINADLTVVNGTLSTVSSSDGDITWTATFTPELDIDAPTNVITLDNTGVVDASGNAGTGTTDSNNFIIRTLPMTLLVTTNLDSDDDATSTASLADDQADGSGLSLREALIWARNGDSITFDLDSGTTGNQGGTITLNGTQLTIESRVSIDGDLDNDGIPDVTLSGSNASRVLEIDSGVTGVELTGLVLTEGNANVHGGGGLAVFNDSSAVVRNSVITDNTNVDTGITGGGGGLYGISADITLIDTTVRDNAANYFGGGIRVVGAGSVLTLVNSTVSGNANTDRDGGGIHFGGTSLTLINTTISGNASTGGTSLGGGIRFGAGNLFIYNSTIVGNVATLAGGGINGIGSGETLVNSVVAGNRSGVGAVAGAGGSALATGGVEDDINTTLDSATNSYFGTSVTINNGTNNLNNQGTAGLLLGDLADNGSYVMTHRPLPGSALSNAGSTAVLPTDTYDLDGDADVAEALPVDARGGNRVMGAAVDIGAVEGNRAPVLQDLEGSNTYIEGGVAVVIDNNVTATDDELDQLNSANGNYSGASITLARNGGVDTSDTFGFVDGSGINLVAGELIKNGQVIAAFDTTTSGELAVTFTDGNGQIPTRADINSVMQQLTYANTSNDPDASVTLNWMVADEAGAPTTETASVTISLKNDAPLVTATGGTPTFTEGGTAVDLFSSVSIDPVEAAQNIIGLQLTVTGVNNGSDEILAIDGSDVALIQGATLTTAPSALDVSVVVAGATATVTLSHATGITGAAAQAIIDGMAYRNASENPNPLSRVVTLSQVQDNGGTVNDGVDTTFLSIAATLTIAAVNNAPTISGTPAVTTEQNAPYSFTPTVADVDSDTLTFSIANQPAWASFDTETGTLSGMPSQAHVGVTNNIVITVSDGEMSTNLSAFNLTVVDVNDAPTISGTPTFSINQDAAYSFTPTADDIDENDVLTFSVTNPPTWASFDETTGALTGTPTSDDVGVTTGIVISVSDGSLSASLPVFDLTVNDTLAPTDHRVSFGDTVYNSSEASDISFTFTGAEVGATYAYTISGTGGTPVTGTGTVTSTSDTVSGIDVSGLPDGALTLSVTLEDKAGNTAAAVTATAALDQTAPTLSNSIPVNDATSVALNTPVTLTFNEAISTGSGSVTLYNAANDDVVEAFAVDSVTANGPSITFTPTALLTPTFSYYVQIDANAITDAAGNTYAGIADKTSLRFTATNATPLANTDTASVAEDASVDIVVLANDTDSDSDLNAASVTVVTAPQHGVTSVNTATGVITYTPAANFNGMDTFTYTVEDVFGAVSSVAAVTLTVIPVNDAPVAVADLANTPEDNPISIDLAANDTDVDIDDGADRESIVIVSTPAHGTAAVVNGEVLYTPNLDYTGSDNFTYTIDDQSGATSNVATVIINVTGVNDLPVAKADSAMMDEDGSVDIDVLANDSDVDGTLDASSVRVLTNPANGSAEVDALTGVIFYTPNANFHGSDSFTYVVQDEEGGTSNAAMVSITIASVNDAPVAAGDTAVLEEDTAHTINVLGDDSDLDGTLIHASVEVVAAAANGTTQVNPTTGAIVYTPGENFSGSDSFTYRVQDNDGAWSNAAAVTITVEAVNDEPLANRDSATTYEDTAVTIDLMANDSDVDGVLDPGSLRLTLPADGAIVDNGDGTVTYTPAANFFGSDSFTYTVVDNEGGISNTASVTVTVDPVNDAPVISGTAATSVNQDSAYSFTPMASDVDPNTTLTFSIMNAPSWATFNTATGALTGTPGNDDVGSYSGITIHVSDGELNAALPTFSIDVINVNDPPEIGGMPPLDVNQDGRYNFVPNVVDVDSDTTLTFSVVNLPHWASFNPATGAITGTPGNSDVGIYNNIVVSVSDGITTRMLDSFDITVANVNDPPIIVADRYSLNEGGLLQPGGVNGLLANDSDIDGDNLIAILVSGPRNAAEFRLNEDGSFRYLHNGGETRTDSFTYRISDNSVNSSPVTVNLVIAAVNDAPQFVTQPPLSILQGANYSYDIGVTDPDSAVQLSLLDGPEWLSLTGSRLSGSAPLDDIGAVQIVLRAQDDEYTVDQTFNLTVLERETSFVMISTNWLGLPSIVDSTVDLQITLTHVSGPALPDATLRVSLDGLDVVSTMANCAAGSSAFTCSAGLNGTSRNFRLRVTPQEEGNLIVGLRLEVDNQLIAETITDVSATERSVSQGNLTFNLANATALASINLLNDGTRELVAGTSLGDTVKLLNYTLASGAAQVLGEIENRGYTERVRVVDIDRDGLEDIVVVNRSGDASAVYYDRGGEFQIEEGSQVLPHAREAVVWDLNDDGYPELILGASGFNLYIYENNEGIYDRPPLVFTSATSIVHFALLRRLPTDLPLEGTLVINSVDTVQLVRFGLDPDSDPAEGELGKPSVNEKFTLLQQLPLQRASSVRLIDVDGDGREEIVVSTTHSNNSSETSGITVIGVTESGQLQVNARLGAASAKNVEVADFNGDGLPDLVVRNENGTYQFYRGSGDSSEWRLTNTVLFHNSTLMITEDVNSDGLADLLIYEDGEEQVELYLSAPDGDTGETADLTLSAAVQVVRNDRYHFAYEATVMNDGLSIARNVRLTVLLPEGIQVVSLPEFCNEDEEVGEVICTLENLEPGSGREPRLILAGDSRINGLSLNSHVTSDALETNVADNTTTTSLEGMFQYKRARIKGGGCLDYLWIAALLALGLTRRRSPASSSSASEGTPKEGSVWRNAATLMPPLFAALLLMHPDQQAHADTENSYLEGTVGMISSEWDLIDFYYDLSGSTQQGVLVEKDDQRLGWQLLYGYRVHRNIALELGYLDSGETELEVATVVSDPEPLRRVLLDYAPASGAGPYAGVRLSFFSRGVQELYAKVGVWSWSAGYAITVSDRSEWVKRSDEDWLFGLGFSLPLLERLNLGGSLQTTALEGDRLMLVGLNLSYRFSVSR